MARSLLLATLQRRQGISFQLKTAGYQVIGTMTLNPSTARHEMEITEEAFLKHSRELARLCAVPGLGWYVAEFREEKPSTVLIKNGVKDWKNGKDPLEPDDDLKGRTFFALRKIAKLLDIDVTKIKGNEPMKTAIRLARIREQARKNHDTVGKDILGEAA